LPHFFFKTNFQDAIGLINNLHRSGVYGQSLAA
jgi:hypothetical protein